jgi:hypothetical protein
MMPDRQERLERAIADYLEAVDAGRAPDPGRWLARHADLQPELAEFLVDQARLDRLVGPLRWRPGGQGDASPPPPAETAASAPPTQGPPADPAPPAGETTEPSDDGDDGAELPRGERVRYFGEYQLRAVLGRGGIGVAYRARQVSLNRPVALKMIRAGVLAGDAEPTGPGAVHSSSPGVPASGCTAAPARGPYHDRRRPGWIDAPPVRKWPF